MSLKVKTEYAEYSHGDMVAGHVELVLDQEATVKRVDVLVRCMIYTEIQVQQSIGQGNGIIEERHSPLHMIKTVFPPDSVSSTSVDKYYTLKAGKYTFTFRFWIPDEPTECNSDISNPFLNGLPGYDHCNSSGHVSVGSRKKHYCDLPPSFESNIGNGGFKIHLGGFREASITYTVEALLYRKGFFKFKKTDIQPIVFRPKSLFDGPRNNILHLKEHNFKTKVGQQITCDGYLDAEITVGQPLNLSLFANAPANHKTPLTITGLEVNLKNDINISVGTYTCSTSNYYRLAKLTSPLVLSDGFIAPISQSPPTSRATSGPSTPTGAGPSSHQPKLIRYNIRTTWDPIPTIIAPSFSTCSIINTYRLSVMITFAGNTTCKLASSVTVVPPTLPPYNNDESAPAFEEHFNHERIDQGPKREPVPESS